MADSLTRFLFSGPYTWGAYAFVALRVVVAAFWLHSDVPRWVGLIAGHPEANEFVQKLFGAGGVVALTYFFTLLETMAAISFILGLMTRLAAVWGVIEFTIIASPLLLGGMVEQALVHALLWSASLVLLLNGSPKLSIDGLIANRVRAKSRS